MKLFKKMFGSQPKKISKYESNTLAEINESPDWRAEKEEEIEVPTKKQNTEKKPTKATAKSVTSKEAAATEKAKTTTTKKESQATKNTANGGAKVEKDKTTVAKVSAKSTSAKSTAKGEKAPSKEPEKKPESTAKSSTQKTANSTDNTTKSKSKVTNSAVKSSDAPVDPKPDKQNADEVAENTSVDNDTGKAPRTGKFEIKKSKDGRYVFNLYASNNVIVATSQVYSSSTAAMNGIKSVIANAPTAPIDDQTLKAVKTVPFPKWEIYRDKSEHYRFRLCASNGSCVCHSQGYTSKTNCKKGIESIIKSATGAEITKAYINKDK